MNIETLLNDRLQNAIQSTYSVQNYTGAILDAIYFLSDLIREKTGLASDGIVLVGQAFGGKSPKLKINKLETESEKNIQTGIAQILRGIYQAIRNPRSHDKHMDHQKDADAIILFINYLVQIIDKSKSPFTKSDLLKRVFDPFFVENERYGQLLASDVPPKYLLEVLTDVFRGHRRNTSKNLSYFISSLISKLSKEQESELYNVISQELRIADNDDAIWTTLQIFPTNTLSRLDETARLRTENKLIKSIKEGMYNNETDDCYEGVLGTWIRDNCKSFILKEELVKVITNKISSEYPDERAYVFEFLWNDFIRLSKPPTPRTIRAIKFQLQKGNIDLYNTLLMEQTIGDTEWTETFKDKIEAFKEPEPTPPKPFEDEDLPF